MSSILVFESGHRVRWVERVWKWEKWVPTSFRSGRGRVEVGEVDAHILSLWPWSC